ncbi:MAG: glycosyltransferase family 2 protein [Prevotella sp.]|nr:glycosyltransferase family 2 protein [Prevotella sp.]
MKLSIVIPVYNVEQTLERCVQSVLNQKFRDYQVILVDDGSTDKSGEICDQLMRQDKRIQVIHQKNSGLSAARNAGIKKCKGEYITFIDSDDYIGTDTLKPLMDLLAIHHDYDILEYSVYEHFGRPKHMNPLRLDNREYTDMREYWYKCEAYKHAYACNKIYSRKLFSGLGFPVGKKFEDIYTLPQLLERCQTVATTGEGYYYYCYNTKGITATADGEALNNLLTAHLNILNGDSFLKPVNYAYYGHILNIALDVYEATGETPKLPLPESVCQRQDGEKIPLKIRLMKLLGLKNLCKINTLIHKFYRKSR